MPFAKHDQHKTAFWRGTALWMHIRMPFGAIGASAAFQHMMDAELTLAGLTAVAVSIIEDMLVRSQSGAQHAIIVGLALTMHLRCGLRAHPQKSIFGDG